MKRGFILIAPLILLMAWGFRSLIEHDFRNADWGMTENEVRASEKENLQKRQKTQSNVFVLERNVTFSDGMSAKLAYFFTNDKLTSTVYWLDEMNNPSKSLRDIEKYLYEKFCRMYGNPIKDSGGNNLWNYNRTRVYYYTLPDAKACAVNYWPLNQTY